MTMDSFITNSTQALECMDLHGVPAYYRPNTSDKRALDEVNLKRTYFRQAIGFDVLPGEHWLDLGANIGAFAVYCRIRGATATCFEPQEDCFKILRKTAGRWKGFLLVNSAVTTERKRQVTMYSSPRAGEHYRGTTFARHGYKRSCTVPNMNIGILRRMRFDGIKIDIEGGEGPILDAETLPRCNKLCLEYHTSVDDDLSHFFSRMEFLKSRFHNVKYTTEYANARDKGLTHFKTFVDRVVFAWGPLSRVRSFASQTRRSRAA